MRWLVKMRRRGGVLLNSSAIIQISRSPMSGRRCQTRRVFSTEQPRGSKLRGYVLRGGPETYAERKESRLYSTGWPAPGLVPISPADGTAWPAHWPNVRFGSVAAVGIPMNERLLVAHAN